MKNALTFAAVAEAATGLALLIAPSLVVHLLLGEQLTGIAIAVARVAGIAIVALAIACWSGSPLVGMMTYSASHYAVSCLPWFCRWLDRNLAVAGRHPSRHPHRTLDSGLYANATRIPLTWLTKLWRFQHRFSPNACRLLSIRCHLICIKWFDAIRVPNYSNKLSRRGKCHEFILQVYWISSGNAVGDRCCFGKCRRSADEGLRPGGGASL